jgi:acyl-CoA synthetase (AMP-forming)/AMP-acid ligase II
VIGIFPKILGEDGDEVPDGKAGNICITNPWPGIMQTVWGQPERFISVYYAKYNTNPESKDRRDWPYFAGDGAVRAPDGYYRILGRVDDVINVAGHRLGTKELESAALTVPEVAEAAAVPVMDDIRGRRGRRLGQGRGLRAGRVVGPHGQRPGAPVLPAPGIPGDGAQQALPHRRRALDQRDDPRPGRGRARRYWADE